jgi:hypothetical protein
MNEYLRDRILRKLETLSDERLYQVLDYVDFLEAKYTERPGQTQNVFQRFAESVEGKLRAGQVSATTVAETMKYMNKAMGVLTGVAAAGRSVASDIVDAARRQGTPTGTAATSPNANSAAGATGNSSSAVPPPTTAPADAATSMPDDPLGAAVPTPPLTPTPTADAGSGEQPL